MEAYLQKFIDFLQHTGIPGQIAEIDIFALLTNPWFLVPLVLLLAYMVWKQAWRDIFAFLIIGGCWGFSGSDYMQGVLNNGEMDLGKLLPVIGGGAIALAMIIYLFFGRSD